MSTIENQEAISNELLLYAKELEHIVLEFAKIHIITRSSYERQIKNLAQLAINKGIDIEDLAKEINQEKKNDLLFEQSFNEINLNKNEPKEKEKDIDLIEMKNISNQIFCKDLYGNLLKFMQRKKDALKISNLMNNTNKIIQANNNLNQNKYKIEQNNIYDNKITNNNISSSLNDHNKSGSKSLGRKRKLK